MSKKGGAPEQPGGAGRSTKVSVDVNKLGHDNGTNGKAEKKLASVDTRTVAFRVEGEAARHAGPWVRVKLRERRCSQLGRLKGTKGGSRNDFRRACMYRQ